MNRPVNRFADRRFLLLWDQPLANPADGWNLTGGPLVAKGKVMQGIGGRGKGGAYIAGLDSETGKEAWRFYTIARPDEPGGNSWNGLPLEQRSGGSVWTAGSYDPDLNLVFFGPAPTYDRFGWKVRPFTGDQSGDEENRMDRAPALSTKHRSIGDRRWSRFW